MQYRTPLFILTLGAIALLLNTLLLQPAYAQHIESVSLSSSFLVTQTTVRPYIIDMAPYYTLDTQADKGHYDEIGFRVAVAGRLRLGTAGLFMQPEIAYTSTTGQATEVQYAVPSMPNWNSFFTFSHKIRRWEVAPLIGWHTGQRGYVAAGPLLALNLREAPIAERPGYPASDVLYNSLNRSVEPVQLLGQVGIGYLLGRFDFSLRLEQSLTPYTRQFTFEGSTYSYRQHIRQGLFTAGILLYKRNIPDAATHPSN